MFFFDKITVIFSGKNMTHFIQNFSINKQEDFTLPTIAAGYFTLNNKLKKREKLNLVTSLV